MPSSPLTSRGWTIARLVPLLAGTLVLAGTAAAATISAWWLIVPALVGANLLLYSAVGWCPATLLMRRTGITSGICPPGHA
ncbi:DUF2892 domain-containing protein [Nocardia cyriacigeorgica]|uniref:DUF2892 domain-containing protein n=1 Tax=Nocardia cyriacigeorgica TaxID=135487 RepID=A0A6P1CQ35_9NOCA|nr:MULTISPECIES: DUF2892 domain-containing protein [Nocardia]MBF6499412.1 DUF2892 domain-containing protein [Nocardia cyriacigeorgica]NEW33336.1 DUF2892 domain-containing protein [Nocardia cyriacigeorgica]BDT85541.1 hypothetical protein FMUAM8_13050 [Nocardia cyriacigeorgica]